MTGSRRRGQGTLEYVLIFALIAIVLVVAGLIFRKQLQNIANQAKEKLEAFMKDPSSVDPLRGGGTEKKGKDAAGQKSQEPKGGPAPGGEKKDSKGGLTVNKPGSEVQVPEDRGFSFGNLSLVKQLGLVGGAIAVAFGIFFFFKQGWRK